MIKGHHQLNLDEHTTCNVEGCRQTCICSCGKCGDHYK